MNQLKNENKLTKTDFDLSIIPVSSEKIPFSTWRKYQQSIAPITPWHSHYLNKGTVG